MTNPDIQQAKEWAESRANGNYLLSERTKAAVKVILSLPDTSTIVDGDKLREVIAEQYMKREGSDTKWINAATIEALLTPPLPTLADMTPEERQACQWMQADVKLASGGSARCVIANPRLPGARVRVWAPHGGSDDVEEERVTPLPGPKLKWPGTEPAETESAVDDLAHAIRLTVEYTGNDLLPAIPGWSWFDALMKHRPDLAQPFIDKPITSPEPATLPLPEDVKPGEYWLVRVDEHLNPVAAERDHKLDAFPWTVLQGSGGDHYPDSYVTLVSRLVPEVAP